ncbi:sialate O-acetylesterase [Candidatus Latescibacterota bacterium]
MKKQLMKYVLLLTLFVLLISAHFTFADVSLPSVFGTNMVLQRDISVPVWGWADIGEKVTVAIQGQRITAETGSDGRWIAWLKPLDTGGPFEMTVSGKTTVTFTNVLVGEVWICSGQSNMEMRVKHCLNADNEVADALYPMIRLFAIKNDLSPEPREDCEAKWEVCRPSTIGDFTAAGYFFGRELMNELDVPIGLINSSWGGTTSETWMSENARTYSPEFNNIVEKSEPIFRVNPDEIITFYHSMAEWEEDVHYAEYVNKSYPRYYIEPPVRGGRRLPICPQMPSWVHNAMLSPLIPYAIRGAIWYQGESNAGRAYEYRSLFPAMIEDWRRNWGQGDFPFLFVQLANFGKSEDRPGESTWAELREAQCMTLSLPNTAMATAVDIGISDNVHPLNKQEVGHRLALGALKTVYGRDIVHSGPEYESMTVQGNKIRVRFSHTGSGLVAKNSSHLGGFAIAGDDKEFVWAEAIIEGNEIVLWSDAVSNPVAVRYAWANNPECSLYNVEGLPALPFRTDDWPGITEK